MLNNDKQLVPYRFILKCPLPRLAMQFQEIVVLPPDIKISVYCMSCTGTETRFEKLYEKTENFECYSNFSISKFIRHAL